MSADASRTRIGGDGAPAAIPGVAPSAAIEALFAVAAPIAHRAAFRITGRREDSEDVLQAVFLHLLRFPPSPWPDSPTAYVQRAAVNAALDLVRSRTRKRETEMDDADGAAQPGRSFEGKAIARLDEQRLAGRLREALAELAPLEAEVFALRAFEDLTNAEIASMLGKTANHVGVALFGARQKLRRILASDGSRAASAPLERSTSDDLPVSDRAMKELLP